MSTASKTFTFTVSAPAQPGIPSWAQGAVNTWVEILGTSMGPAMLNPVPNWLSYSGGSLHPTTLKYYMMGGGHADDWQNNVMSIDLTLASPTWVRESQPTPLATLPGTSINGFPYYPDGRPAATHNWSNTTQVIPSWGTQGRLVKFGANSVWGNGNGIYSSTDAWDIAAKEYTWLNTNYATTPNGPNPTMAQWPGTSGVNCAAKDTNLGHVWCLAYGGYAPYRRWNCTNQTWDLAVANGYSEANRIMSFDSFRNRVVSFPGNSAANYFTTFNADGTGLATTTNTTGYQFSGGGCIIYEPTLDKFVWMQGHNGTTHPMFTIHPTTFAVTPLTQSGWTIPSVTQSSDQPHSRFCYIPNYKGVIFFNNVNTNVRFMRLA